MRIYLWRATGNLRLFDEWDLNYYGMVGRMMDDTHNDDDEN